MTAIFPASAILVTACLTVGCAGPGTKEDWSDVMPAGAQTYLVGASVKVEDADDSVVGGAGYKMRNARNGLRIEGWYGGSGDDVDKMWGALLEATAYITPWRLGSRDTTGKGFVFDPFVDAGLRFDSVKFEDTSKLDTGVAYGEAGIGLNWWWSQRSRFYIDGRVGTGLNFGSVESPDFTDGKVESDPTLKYRVELGLDWNRLLLQAFWDVRNVNLTLDGVGAESETSLVGLQLGYNW
jgi:hypothetical protein